MGGGGRRRWRRLRAEGRCEEVRLEEHCTEPTDNNELSLREWTLGNGEMGGVIVRRRRGGGDSTFLC